MLYFSKYIFYVELSKELTFENFNKLELYIKGFI
jgi:hypothetical protein